MPLDPILLASIAAAAVVVIAVVAWLLVSRARVGRAAASIAASRAALSDARAALAAAGAGDERPRAELDDEVQAARRTVNAATREGEALRRRFPSSLFASRIPEPQYEEAGGGTAEPPRIAF